MTNNKPIPNLPPPPSSTAPPPAPPPPAPPPPDEVTEESKPGLPPPPDPAWLQEQIDKGNIAPDPKPEDRYKNPPILKPRRTPQKFLSSARTQALDKKLGDQDYYNVFVAYAKTGVPKEIANLVDPPMTLDEVEHLLYKGVVRLKLPPIVQHATDYAEVNKRLAKFRIQVQDMDAPSLMDPNVQAEITNRVAQEAALSQAAILASGKAMQVYFDFMQAVQNSLLAEDGGFLIPEKIDVGFLEKVGKFSKSFVETADKAVRFSRFTGGEPEDSMSALLARMVEMLSPQELAMAAQGRGLPRKFRSRGDIKMLADAVGVSNDELEGLIDITPDVEKPTDTNNTDK